jgi:hypothetical protein
MVAQREPQHMAVEEWREFERSNPDTKYEYIDWQVCLYRGTAVPLTRVFFCAMLWERVLSS